jgi:hypothetical protein
MSDEPSRLPTILVAAYRAAEALQRGQSAKPSNAPNDVSAFFKTSDCDNRARLGLRDLSVASTPAAIWSAMATVSIALAELLADDAAMGSHATTPDVVERYEGLAHALKKSTQGFLAKRRKTYLELRVMKVAERCTRDTTPELLSEQLAALTEQDDPRFAGILRTHRAALATCIAAAAARGVKDYEWISIGRRSQRRGHDPRPDTYEKAFSDLCLGVGLTKSEKASRAAARSRAKRKNPR